MGTHRPGPDGLSRGVGQALVPRRGWGPARRRLGLVAVVPALALLAAACGGTGSAATGLSASEREAALLNFSKCMRQNGVNIPDPTVDANGNVVLRPRQAGNGSGNGGNPNALSASQRQKFQRAQTACQKYLRGLTQRFSQADRTKVQDALVKYAQCVRKNGYNLPDPDFDTQPSAQASPGNGPQGRGPFSSINRNDPAFQKADKACRSILSNIGGPFGGAGGPAQGGNTP